MALQHIEFGRQEAAASCGIDGGCGCHTASAPAPVDTEETSTTLLVSGMTCEHCVRAVTDELSALPSVERVQVELVAGGSSRVHVTGALDLGDARTAVEEAGYTLVED